MGMDINALRERIGNLNRRTVKANDIWKPKDEHDVRLVQYPHGDDSFVELHFHYEVGDNPSILCPKVNFGKECEICDFCDLLKSWKNPDGDDKPDSDRKKDWEIFKKIQPKARIFIPMIERGKEADGVKFWGVTPNQSLSILEVCSDGDRLSELGISADDAKSALRVVFDSNKAYDLHVSFAKPGDKGNTKSFAQVGIKGKIKATPLMADKKLAEELVASVKTINEVYPEISSEEVSRMLKKFVGNGAVDAKPEGGVEKYSANTKENAKVTGGKSIDEAFGDMLDE